MQSETSRETDRGGQYFSWASNSITWAIRLASKGFTIVGNSSPP